MPTFPRYADLALPKQLNPLDPRHWLMVLNWVFFYPPRLKQYLYRADPELYTKEGFSALRLALHQPAYRSLLAVSLFITIIVPFIFWGMSTLTGVGVGLTVGLASGLAVGVVVGVVIGVAVLVAFDVAFSVAFSVVVGVAVGVAGVVAGVVAVSVTRSVTGSVTGGVTVGVAVGIAVGLTVSVAFSVAGGVAFGVASGVAGGVAFGVAGGVAFGVAFGVKVGVAVGVVGSASSIIGSLQIHASMIEFLHCLMQRALLIESAILPLPRTSMDYLRQQVNANPEQFGNCLRPLIENSIRSHSVYRLCTLLLQQNTDPIHLLYNWLLAPAMDEYISSPITKSQFRRFPPLRPILLAGLSNIFVDPSGGISETSERTVWLIARRIYRSEAVHPLVVLTALLLDLDLLNQERDKASDHLEGALQQINQLQPLSDLRHGKEIIESFHLLKQAYEARSIEAIGQLQSELASSRKNFPTPLRQEVIEMLAALADIAQEVVNYIELSNRGAQGAALNRALSMLNELAPHAKAIPLPEHSLIEAVIEHWQDLIAQEAGRAGERALREARLEAQSQESISSITGSMRSSGIWQRPALPYANPYITGRPVSNTLFVGRAAILRQIVDRWRSSNTPDSVILYGHRRMGKTSIVKNLAAHAPSGSLLAYLTLDGATATAEQAGDLLLDLAEKIYAVAVEKYPELPQPQFADYQQAKNADLNFQRLLRAVTDKLPPGAFLILALDEFEALENAVEKGKFDKSVYGYLRMLSQQSRLTLILAGLHTLDEMSRDYQQAFYSSYHNVRVSYLSPSESEQLIARPTTEFTLNYERSVIAEIYRLTYGQPLLIQSICSALVEHLNHELFDLEVEREARILPADLQAVLTDDFLRREARYFDGIWRDQLTGHPEQQAILHILASQDTSLTAEQLVTSSNLSVSQVNDALSSLAKRDLIIEENGTWRLLMPLFQRWLRLLMRESNPSGNELA